MSRKDKRITNQETKVIQQVVNLKNPINRINTTTPGITAQDPQIKQGRLPNAPYRSPKCELCQSNKTKVYSVRRVPAHVHYIKCWSCGWTFKDVSN